MTHTNYERLIIELANKQYFTAEVLSTFLEENALVADEAYSKATNEKQLLQTIIDILEALSNDIDLFRTVETEFATTGEAYKFLRQRISDVTRRMNAITDEQSNFSNIGYLYHD